MHDTDKNMAKVNAIELILNGVDNKADFASIIGTVIKSWTMQNGIDCVSFVKELCEATEYAEQMLPFATFLQKLGVLDIDE